MSVALARFARLAIVPCGLVFFVKDGQALPTRDGSAILRGDVLHLRAMSRLPVARVTEHHAVLIEGMQVAFLSLVPGHG